MDFDRYFSRRRFLSTLTVLGAPLAFAANSRAAAAEDAAQCVQSAEQEEGPHYLNTQLVRGDIAEDRRGVPLVLGVTLLNARTCAPLAGAIVDVWHCDAFGLYSGFTRPHAAAAPEGGQARTRGGGGRRRGGGRSGMGFGGPSAADDAPPRPLPGEEPGKLAPDVFADASAGAPPKLEPTDPFTFLRGIQRTDGAGRATFHTIVPGNDEGRTNHVHFKVRGTGAPREDSRVSHVGQIFFPEFMMVELMGLEPYSNHAVKRTPLSEDPVFEQQGGAAMVARVGALSGNEYTKGLKADIVVAVDPEAVPTPAARHMGG